MCRANNSDAIKFKGSINFYQNIQVLRKTGKILKDNKNQFANVYIKGINNVKVRSKKSPVSVRLLDVYF